MRSGGPNILLPEVVLIAYRNGYFPMGDPESGRILWHHPNPRAIIPLDRVRFSRSLRQTLKRNTFHVTVNTCFDRVIEQCALRHDTWITPEIIEVYLELHQMGFAHSMEAWKGDELAGGLYGVAIGGAFFGESMFTLERDASKVTFAHLVLHLNQQGFSLLDTQYINEFTASLGAIEISDEEYGGILAHAISADIAFQSNDSLLTG